MTKVLVITRFPLCPRDNGLTARPGPTLFPHNPSGIPLPFPHSPSIIYLHAGFVKGTVSPQAGPGRQNARPALDAR